MKYAEEGLQYHIAVKNGDVGKYVIMPGDPKRCKKIAAYFDDAKLIKYGTFTTTAENDIERFAMVRAWLLSIISSWRPDYIGIEGV